MSTHSPPPGVFSHAGFAEVAAALARHAGLKIPPHRYPELEQAIRRGMARARIADPGEYARNLAEGHLPLADLVGAFTVGETYFFRDAPQLDLLCARVLPELLARRPPNHVLRAWSAGCASGEEPYTLAILFDRAGLGDRWQVLGTDISRPALARARAGAYGPWSLRGAARDRAESALERDADDRFVVPARLRARVRIEYLNLAEDVYPSVLSGTSGLDLIFCRNVFIYFERDVVAAVARRLHACLAEGGWLFTGLADPPLGAFAPLQSISTVAGVVYRRPARGEAAGVRWTPPERPDAGAAAGPPGSPVLAPPRPPPAPPPRPPPAPPAAGPVSSPIPGPSPSERSAPTDPPDPLSLASAAARAGDWDAVLELADDLLETPEGAATALRAAANSGDLERADDLAGRAIARHPLASELHLLRAAMLAEVGRTADALAAVRRTLYLAPGLAVAHAALAGLLAGRGDVEGARRAWRNVRRLCAAVPPDAPLPLGDGECAGRLSEIASAQLSLLRGDPNVE
ncbi:protein-glutamate O-methyltransferase CheR [Anaeromyxobacter oryzisoli]|uniref:protein-glutamate O-methyltransferase CheR n=1 Tax=Anaeromyxobacter oryzisoli TaxID=2925408 RepID=UPI0027E0C377|nr:protein-glutamate O-methyltransferase CheR [Anaeromyxobacter sp. SG63]